MRRGLNPCIINSDRKAQKLQRLDLGDRAIGEEFLQEALNANPDLVPAEEIDPSYAPLVSLGREIDCIDNLFISPSGRITLVETKLWRNPQATREVVAQILEYANRLTKWSYTELEEKIRTGLNPNPLGKVKSLYQYVASKFPKDVLPEEQFIDEVSKTLRNGRFLLLLVGDGIRENVQDLLESLHSHPQLLFTFGMVEIQIYENPGTQGTRIVIPSLIVNTVEVVRAVVKVHAAAGTKVSVELEDEESKPRSGGRRALSEKEFFNEIEDEGTKQTYRKLLALGEEVGAVPGWRSSSVSVQLPDPKGSKQKVTLFVLFTSGEVCLGWTQQQMDLLGLPQKLCWDYVKAVAALIPGLEADHDFLNRNPEAAEVEQVLERFKDAVKAFVHKIKEASKK